MSKAEQDFIQADERGDVFKFPLPINYQDRKYISQHFGKNPKAYAQWGASHAGTDIAVPVGTPVYSARTGTVVACRSDKPAKYLGLYAHLSRIPDTCQKREECPAGDRIGASGNTGNATDPHLHFGECPLPKADNGYRGFINAESSVVQR